MQNSIQRYAPLATIAKIYAIPQSTLKLKLWVAKKKGIEFPLRARVGKGFLYDTEAFGAWLFANAADLKIPSAMTAK